MWIRAVPTRPIRLHEPRNGEPGDMMSDCLPSLLAGIGTVEADECPARGARATRSSLEQFASPSHARGSDSYFRDG